MRSWQSGTHAGQSPAHHDVVFSPKRSSATAVMRCCPEQRRRQEKSKEPRQSHNPHVNVIPEILLKTCWTLNNTLERYFIENPQENSARSFMMPFHEWGNRGLQRSNKWLAKAMYLVRGRIWTQILIEPHPFIWQKENLLGMFFVLNFCFFLALLHNLQDLSVPQPGIEPGSWL